MTTNKPIQKSSNRHAQSSHFRRAVACRRADLQGSRHRGRFPARPRQGQGETRRAGRQLRRPRHPLGHQSVGEDPGKGQESEGDRPRRHRRRQCRHSGGDRARHHRDEHAVRQFHHHRRTRDLADAGLGPPDSGSRYLHPRRQMGKEQVHGRGDLLQDARRHRLRQYRLDRRRPRHRPEDEGDRLRSVSVGGARARSRRREGRARRAVQARRFHHAAHPAHRQDQEHHRRRRHQEDEKGRAHHQLRARRPGRRGGAGRGAQGGAGGGRGLRRVRRGAGDAEPAVQPAQRGVHAASRRRHQRGAGKRRAAGGRADVRLSVARRDLQRGQFPLDQRRGSAQAQAVRRARREARLLRRPVDRKPDQGNPDHLRGRGGADEYQGAHLGGARRPAAADARQTSTWCRRRWWRASAAWRWRRPRARRPATTKA